MLAIDWTGGLEDAWTSVANFVPKLVGALAILLIGWIIAKFIAKAVAGLLRRVNFDGWVDKSGLGRPLANAGYSDSGKLLAKLVYFAIMLLVIQLAVEVFGNDSLSEAFNGLLAFIPKLFIAIIIVILTGVIANAVKGFIQPMLQNSPAGPALTTIAVASIWVIGGFAALDQLAIAQNVVDTLFQALTYGLGLIFVISFGIGGINAARDRFWPWVYDSFTGKNS